MTTDNTDREELEPCPWCGALSDERDKWGYLITHKSTCYWLNIHGDPIGRVRINFSEAERWNTRSRAAVAAPRRYFCSCGGALTADEYIVHYFEMGHDRGEQPRNSAREKLDAIIVRCTDGDLSHDWRAVIGRLAREALASLPPVAPSLIPEQDEELGHDGFHCENCERTFQDRSHATDDGYWLCDPCWRGLNSEQVAATKARWHCDRQPWACRYPNARQCAHDTALGGECPQVCKCECHAAATPATATAAELVDREEAAKMAFDAIKAALQGDWTNHYSVLQIAGMVAANIRRLSPVAATSGARAAAEEIADYVSDGILGIGNEVTEVNAARFLEIISKHFPADAV